VNDLSKHLHDTYNVLFSTDFCGFLGNPLVAIDCLKMVCNDEIKFGLEAVAFKHVIKNLHPKSLNGTSEFIGGYHGRIGWSASDARTLFDHSKVLLLDSQITETQLLLQIASQFNRPIYVNIHEGELNSNLGNIQTNSTTLVVENDISPESVDKAFQLSDKLGIGRIYDLVHGGRSRPNFNWYKDWKVISDEMKKFRPTLVHIPIGTDASDSLPNIMPEQFWEELGKLRNELCFFPIVECQWGINRGSIICEPHKDPWRIRYLQAKLKILVDNDVVKK
jgi:hypothetical protein